MAGLIPSSLSYARTRLSPSCLPLPQTGLSPSSLPLPQTGSIVSIKVSSNSFCRMQRLLAPSRRSTLCGSVVSSNSLATSTLNPEPQIQRGVDQRVVQFSRPILPPNVCLGSPECWWFIQYICIYIYIYVYIYIYIYAAHSGDPWLAASCRSTCRPTRWPNAHARRSRQSSRSAPTSSLSIATGGTCAPRVPSPNLIPKP